MAFMSLNWIVWRGRDLLVDLCSLVLFAYLDVLDGLLCCVFAVVDSIWCPHCSSCYCHKQSGTECADSGSVGLEGVSGKDDVADCLQFNNPSQTVQYGARHGRDRKALGGRQSALWALSEWVRKGLVQGRVLEGKVGGKLFSTNKVSNHTCWSDCSCHECTSWQGEDDYLYVHVEDVSVDSNGSSGVACPDTTNNESNWNGGVGCPDTKNVVFLHGFLSSSTFWSHAVLSHLSKSTGRSYRLFAPDLLGWGKSPKPRDSGYTISDQITMIKRSLAHKYGVEKFHVVGHSMGCVIALALAAQDPRVVQSVTLIAPPYFPAPEEVRGSSHYFLCQVAPKKVWPMRCFGSAVMSWYEHVGRLSCLTICKNHRLWEPLLLFMVPKVVGHWLPQSFIRDFTRHTHNSGWHSFHNTLCAGADVVDKCMRVLENAGRSVWAMYGDKDCVCPPKCSLELANRFSNVRLKHIPGVDHLTTVLGREEALADDLADIIGSENNRISGD